MAWTYFPGQIATVPRNRVRLMIGDTTANDPQMEDEEIDALLVLHGGSVEAAALTAARSLQAKYARYVDKWVGDLKILASQKARAYGLLIETMTGAAGLMGMPSAGGIRVGEKEAHADDDDLVAPSFTRGRFDNLEES